MYHHHNGGSVTGWAYATYKRVCLSAQVVGRIVRHGHSSELCAHSARKITLDKLPILLSSIHLLLVAY